MPMTKQTGKPEWWEQAKKELSEADPVMAEIIKANPEGYLETRGNPFETLLHSVIGQQISVKAALIFGNGLLSPVRKSNLKLLAANIAEL